MPERDAAGRRKLTLSRSFASAVVCCAVALGWDLSAIESTALPLPYPASYPSENYSPPRVELNGLIGGGIADANAPSDAAPAPKGIAFGKFSMHPNVSFEATETDNARRARLHPKDDELLEYAAGLKTEFKPLQCVRATLNYEFGWHDYLKDTARDYLSHNAETEIRIDRVGVQGLSLVFSDAYLQTGSINPLENEVVQFSRYHANRALAGVEYKYNRFKISGTYTEAFTHYFARTDAVSDFITHAGGLEGSWQWLPGRLEIFENFQLQRTLFDKVPNNDYDSTSALTGVRGKYSKLTYSVAIGYSRVDPLHGSTSHSGVGFNAFINYAPHRRLAVDVTASRSFQAGVLTGSSMETNLNAMLTLLLTRRGNLQTSYTRNFSDRLNNTQQLSVAYGTRFEYKLARNATLNTGFLRIERTGTPATVDYIINEVRGGFKLTW